MASRFGVVAALRGVLPSLARSLAPSKTTIITGTKSSGTPVAPDCGLTVTVPKILMLRWLLAENCENSPAPDSAPLSPTTPWSHTSRAPSGERFNPRLGVREQFKFYPSARFTIHWPDSVVAWRG